MSATPLETYREEAHERLGELEDALLELEEAPADQELIGRIFRALHTIKGSGAMFGFDEIAAFTHEVETVFDLVRNGEIAVGKHLIDLTLKARDRILSMLDGTETGGDAGDLTAAFREFLPGSKFEEGTGEAPVDNAPEKGGDASTWRIRFRPVPEIFASGTNPLLLLDEIRRLGEAKIVAQLDAVPPLEEMDPELCYTYWDIILTTDQGMNAIKDVFIFVEDLAEITIELAEEQELKLGEIFVERGDVTKKDLEKVLKEKKPIGELLVEAGLVTTGKVEAALAEQEHIRGIKGKQRKEEAASSIRVDAEKLDKLVNLVGELVTVQAGISQIANSSSGGVLLALSEEVERLTAELRDTTLNIRMLPIGTTFGRFKRLVRDLSGDLGKEIEMTTDGAGTELDKTVIERLNDPLVHLIRNSIDHGIEQPDERVRAGKPRTGTVHLSAVQSGGNVVIRIRDDGKGLDRDAILAKAVERGLVAANVEVPDKELFSFIFHPGFSTAKEVTSVSGRGVGMDVVKRSVEALRGSIGLTSEKGKGTTVTVTLPLTLAIVEGLLVSIKEDYFVLPLSSVEECVELTREDVTKTHGRHVAHVRGSLVPYVRLREEFLIDGDLPDREQIVITEIDRNRIGFVVDQVIGQHQTVIKSLGRMYRGAEGISGATILGDGTVALIMDTVRLQQMAEKGAAAGATPLS